MSVKPGSGGFPLELGSLVFAQRLAVAPLLAPGQDADAMPNASEAESMRSKGEQRPELKTQHRWHWHRTEKNAAGIIVALLCGIQANYYSW